MLPSLVNPINYQGILHVVIHINALCSGILNKKEIWLRMTQYSVWVDELLLGVSSRMFYFKIFRQRQMISFWKCNNGFLDTIANDTDTETLIFKIHMQKTWIRFHTIWPELHVALEFCWFRFILCFFQYVIHHKVQMLIRKLRNSFKLCFKVYFQ